MDGLQTMQITAIPCITYYENAVYSIVVSYVSDSQTNVCAECVAGSYANQSKPNLHAE